jgi:hypothetical protein
VPDTVTILSDPDSMVAKVEAPSIAAEALEEEEAAAAVSAEPEVITGAKDKEEGEE